jgi:hypothetical protein
MPELPIDNYAEQWREYRRLRRNYFLGYFVAIICAGAVLALVDRLTRGYFFNGPLRGIVIVMAVAALFPLKGKVAVWPCPRCGASFSSRPHWPLNLISFPWLPAKCVHCRLAVNAEIVRGESMIQN